MSSSAPYRLIYHAGIPGRGEFPRLYLEATGTSYEDTALTCGQDEAMKYVAGKFDRKDSNPPIFAPPALEHGDLVISQTPNIIFYLSTKLPAVSLDEESKTETEEVSEAERYHRQQVLLTILDFANETHDTHHPLASSLYYEDQKEAALERTKDYRENRVPKYFSHFDDVIQASGTGFLTKGGPSYADLALFQVVDGLNFAFPKLMSQILPTKVGVAKLYDRIHASPKIAAYLNSDRRQPYSMGLFRKYPELDAPEADQEPAKKKVKTT